MSTPIVYRSTDTDAPVFIPNDTSTWLTLIKQCLVYGYTDRPAAGWSLAYEDTVAGTLVLKQGGGNERYMWMGAAGYNNTSNYGSRWIYVKGYSYMTDINTGVGQFPAAGVDNMWCLAPSSNSTSATPQDWIIIATNKFIFIMIYSTAWYSTNYIPKTSMFFGDFKSTIPGDGYNTIVNGYVQTPGYGTYNSTSNNSLTEVYPFTFGTTTAMPTTGLWLAGPFYQQLGMPTVSYLGTKNIADTDTWCGGGNNSFPDFCSNQLNVSQMTVREGWNGYISTRGTLPGFFAPCFSPPHVDGTIIQGEGDQVGHTFLVVNNSRLPGGAVLYIQLDSWDD